MLRTSWLCRLADLQKLGKHRHFATCDDKWIRLPLRLSSIRKRGWKKYVDSPAYVSTASVTSMRPSSRTFDLPLQRTPASFSLVLYHTVDEKSSRDLSTNLPQRGGSCCRMADDDWVVLPHATMIGSTCRFGYLQYTKIVCR